MSVFTIYFCGTKGSSGDVTNGKYYDGELVAKLFSIQVGTDYGNKIIIDGVGSGDLQLNAHGDRRLWVERNASGFSLRGHSTGGLYASGTGSGWQMNVRHAMAVVKCQPDSSRKINVNGAAMSARLGGDPVSNIHQINLVGWSRGAITCFMMAHALQNDALTSHIRVKIFAVDPVAGANNNSALIGQTDRSSLASNVDAYFGVYARDERTFGFSSMIPMNNPANKDYQCLLLPGGHASLVGNNSVFGDTPGQQNKNQHREPGMITRHHAIAKLTSWGTGFLPGSGWLSEQDRLACYARMVKEDKIYQKMRTFCQISESYDSSLTSDKSGHREIQLNSDRRCTALINVPQLINRNHYVNWEHEYLCGRQSERA